MSFVIEITSLKSHDVYRMAGPVTIENMLALAHRVRAGHLQTGQKRVLLDCAGLSGSLSLGEMFIMGVEFSQIIPAGMRLAAFNTPREWRENRFSEDVLHNRGRILRHFDSEDEAIVWLGSSDIES